MTDIEMVKVLTGYDDINDAFVSFYLDSTEKFVRSYCNLDKIPEDLKPTVLEITALRVKANSDGKTSTIGEGIHQVGSISDGNQSIGYQGGATAGKQFISEEDFIAAYGFMLDRWRRLVVNRPTKRPLGAREFYHEHSRRRW